MVPLTAVERTQMRGIVQAGRPRKGKLTKSVDLSAGGCGALRAQSENPLRILGLLTLIWPDCWAVPENRTSCPIQAVFYVPRKFHEPRAVAQSIAGDGSGLYGAGSVRADSVRTYNRHSESGWERN